VGVSNNRTHFEPPEPANHSRLHTTQQPDLCQLVTPELVSLCIHKLALGKACSPDDLSVEHILYAHRRTPVLCFVSHDFRTSLYVPAAFGVGTIVPLVKDKSKNLNDIDNYRPITLIPAISKIFEHVLLSLYEEQLVSDDLQFGFKHGLGCNEAIFALRRPTTVSHFTAAGSSVYL